MRQPHSKSKKTGPGTEKSSTASQQPTVLLMWNNGLETWKPLSLSADNDSQVDSDDYWASTMSHHPCVFFHLFYISTHLCNAHVAGEVVPRDDGEPPGLSQRHSPDMDAGQGSPQLSPESRQQSYWPQVSTMSYIFSS